MISYSRSDRSRRNNSKGKQLEKLILAGCTYYQQKGIAAIEKTPEPFGVLKKYNDGTFLGRFYRRAQPDFQGTLSDGRSIIFEAKSTEDDRINQSVLTKAQHDYSELHYQLGAYVGVCVQIKKIYAFIPWEIWRQMKEVYGRKYLTEKEAAVYSVKTPGFIGFLEYQDKESNHLVSVCKEAPTK
ncbi:Holliday junction resolvase RecU [Enterococcus ureilyticus]|uniref:Holliday junction resolvase RecU n=1 Tax=Enterococcus ureilyticus TaxID=1131292 RepID=UPI001A9124E9|nr:Holliday junction resolvase RecU [Enterococcus ureilyticus]MBO0445583.1 Holliday junction resolvase RecU [Enterococcus ureilyticus]